MPAAGPAISAGQCNDSLAFVPLMERLKVARRGRGRPRTRPGRVLSDKAYSSGAIRAHVRRRGIKATVPEPADQAATGCGVAAGGPATSFRRCRLQAAQHRRTCLRPAPSAARRGHPVRQTRLRLARNRRCRLNPDLAPPSRPMIYGTRSSGASPQPKRGMSWG